MSFLLFLFFSIHGWVRPLILIEYFIGSNFLTKNMTVILQYWICDPYWCNGAVSYSPVYLIPLKWSRITVIIVYCFFCWFFWASLHEWVRPLVLIGHFIGITLLIGHTPLFSILVLLRYHVYFDYMLQVSDVIYYLP